MNRTITECVTAAALVLLAVTTAWAQDYCDNCESDSCCPTYGYTCDGYGTSDFVEVGYVVEDIEGSRPSFYDPGYYPQDIVTSVRFHAGDRFFSKDRFELRWWDDSKNAYRAWTRVSLYPLTYELDRTLFYNFGWNLHDSANYALQEQDMERDFHQLRIHKGELDNMLVTFDINKWDRNAPGNLQDYSYRRMTYNYNFDLCDGKVKGQARRRAQSVSAPRLGPGAYDTETSSIKLDAPLGDDMSVYGRGSYTLYDYQDLPDEEFDSHDYTLGLRYRPDWYWELSADYHAKQYPTDNTVSSHVEDTSDYGIEASYDPCGSSRYEVGFRHRNVSYTQLHMQDPTVATPLRGTALLTPADVAGAVTELSPEQDEIWLSVSRKLLRNLSYSNWLSYKEGEMPATDLVTVGAASLFYDLQFDFRNTLTYDVNGNDQLTLTTYDKESSNGDRGGDFDIHSLEASWSRCVGGNGYLTLMYRDTAYDQETPNLAVSGTTDDSTYLANFRQDLDSFSYGLDLSFTDGSGSEEYEQIGAGADLKFKKYGPIGLRIDWFDRDYAAHPIFDAEALEVMLNYRIDF